MSDTQSLEVHLRPWSEGDLWLLERLMGDPAMTQYLGGPESPEKIRSRHEKYVKFCDSGQGCMYAILVGPGNNPAGSIGYWEREEGDEQKVWETGWSVLPEYQERGIATQATMLLAGKARTAGKHRYLHAYPSVENIASNAICRKAGFTLLGDEEFEYPPGHFMRCNDWVLDLFPD